MSFKYVTLVHAEGNITWRSGDKGTCRNSRVLTPPKRLRQSKDNFYENTYSAVTGGVDFDWWLYKEARSWAKDIGGRVVHDYWSVKPVVNNSSGIPNVPLQTLPDVSKVEKWFHFDADGRKSIFTIEPTVLSADWPSDESPSRRDVLLDKLRSIEESSTSEHYVYCIRYVKDNEPAWYVGETSQLENRIRTHSYDKNIVDIENIIKTNKTDAKEIERELSYRVAIEHNTTEIYGGR